MVLKSKKISKKKNKFNKQVKSKQITPLTNDGFEEYVIKETENKKTKEKEVNIFSCCRAYYRLYEGVKAINAKPECLLR